MTMRSLVRACFVLMLVLAAGAPDLVRADAGPAAISPNERASWSARATRLRARAAAAALRQEAATAAYSRMLTRRYPAGDAKLAIVEERELAAEDYADALAEVREFKEQARRAGVPDSWIDPEGDPPPWWVDPQ